MATGLQNQEEVPENQLKKKLAAAVRSVQWSYAIFWSISTRHQGALEWGDGYYNGDIKTRKTVQHMELNADEMGLQRSEQLSELYESLSAGDNNQQAKRPSAALSPEDLTDAEWYYLVCMSFIFNPGQGLPGRALANGHHIWLHNAPYADSKVFTRSLLAKSASIQISEDPSLLQTAKTAFLEFPNPVCSEQSACSPQKADNDEDLTGAELDQETANNALGAECEMLSEGGGGGHAFPLSCPSYPSKEEREKDPEKIEEPKTGSCNDSSNGCCPHQHTDDSFMPDGLNGTASQVQSWQFVDDDFSNGLHGSVNSSDCISRCHVVNPEKAVATPKGGNVNNLLHDLQECNHTKLGLLNLERDNSHYSRTLCAIFGNANRLGMKPYFHNGSCESSFAAWRKDSDAQKPSLIGGSQKMLKKILFDVTWMHGGCLPKIHEELGCKLWKIEAGNISVNHVLSERRRREKLNEKFLVLRSLIPSISKVDKASILGDTIEYLKELERRVEELEGCKEFTESGARERRKHPDIVERTSDNYGNNEIVANGQKLSINKRKACDIDKAADVELNWVLSKDCLADMTVTIIEKEVVIEMRCPWRECLLIEIVDAISGLHLDAHSVQSSTIDGVLTLALKSKFRGGAVASAGMIKQTLQRVVSKC
ncbi:transcription factor GLABRA 3-like isoform X2 [Magnolia sinica]|uniref:transcription factor GLABRA 3-like isoform X2 n=1 Tax=Magnolia sinica TaxID=86752 RepID=UPI0026580525|nr:transcription factor GLABRA 3-like isoform X2 [Magnolia sinica]